MKGSQQILLRGPGKSAKRIFSDKPSSFTNELSLIYRPPPREESYRPVDFETASRVEQRYVPLDSRGRAQEPVPYYTSVGPSDIVSEKVWKRPTNITGTNESINVRKLPYRDEVIVLSP
jgi:hypothetical protein